MAVKVIRSRRKKRPLADVEPTPAPPHKKDDDDDLDPPPDYGGSGGSAAPQRVMSVHGGSGSVTASQSALSSSTKSACIATALSQVDIAGPLQKELSVLVEEFSDIFDPMLPPAPAVCDPMVLEFNSAEIEPFDAGRRKYAPPVWDAMLAEIKVLLQAGLVEEI
jgi:hypothetical protein